MKDYIVNSLGERIMIDKAAVLRCARKAFKIGSRVKIISYNSACVIVVPEMEKYINKTAKITNICRKSVRLDIDNRKWYWGIDMLELLDSVAVLDNE